MKLEKKFNEALRYHSQGLYDDALKLYKSIFRKDTTNFMVANNIGIIYLTKRNFNEALIFLTKAVSIKTDFSNGFNNRALCHKALGNFNEAIKDFESSLKINPNSVDALLNIGNCFFEMRKFTEASQYFKKLINLNQLLCDGFTGYANCMKELGKIEDAEKNYLLALENGNDNFRQLLNLGTFYKDLENYEKSIKYYSKALSVNPDSYKANYALAVCHEKTDDLDSATKYLQQAINIDSTNPDGKWNLSLIQLLRGDYEAGQKNYENRINKDSFKNQYKFVPSRLVPYKNLDEVKDKILFVMTEQGLGDYIQYMRYFHLIQKHGAKLIIDPPKGTQKIIDSMGFSYINYENNIAYDDCFYLMSIPYLFKNILNFNNHFPYVNVSEKDKEIWSEELIKNSKKNIGIVWAGNKNHSRDKERSIAIKLFESLFTIDVNFYSLMIEHDTNEVEVFEKHNNVNFLNKNFSDFYDTASFVANLDLVITVDTSVAHLAGALNIPTWLLVTFIPDFRWELKNIETLIYPSFKIYRQDSQKSWEEVMKLVSKDLSNLI